MVDTFLIDISSKVGGMSLILMGISLGVGEYPRLDLPHIVGGLRGCIPFRLDKQVDIGLIRLAQVGSHTGELNAVNQLFCSYTHHVHGHGAGN